MTKEKESKRIFIHIPKTGGTSINCDMNGTEWQTTPGFNYRHIIYQTKCSNSADIFDPKLNRKYIGCELFMMLRDPIDRLFSEYYFLRDRKEFFSLLSKKPTSFYEYCLLSNTQNGMIKFLIGKKIYSNMPVFEKHYKQVQDSIDSLSIRVGIFERYGESLAYFSKCFKCDWSKMMDKKRITLSKPDSHSLSLDQIDEIKRLNKYDYRMYESAKEIIEAESLPKDNFTFVGNKYDYVSKYTERFVLMEGALKNKIFIKNNSDYFSQINKELHSRKLTGKEYVDIWNEKVEKKIRSFSETMNLDFASLSRLNGLEKTYALAHIVDQNPIIFNSLDLAD